MKQSIIFLSLFLAFLAIWLRGPWAVQFLAIFGRQTCVIILGSNFKAYVVNPFWLVLENLR